jgi:hypothetical protein
MCDSKKNPIGMMELFSLFIGYLLLHQGTRKGPPIQICAKTNQVYFF